MTAAAAILQHPPQERQLRLLGPCCEAHVAILRRYPADVSTGKKSPSEADWQTAAEAWGCRFDVDTTDAWMDCGCFDPRVAAELSRRDLSPAQCQTRVRDDDFSLRALGEVVAQGRWTPRQAELYVYGALASAEDDT